MEYLKNKQAEDPSFFYAMQLDDDDGTIMNIFWTDGQAIMDYSVFGDALSFDTTFSTMMPFRAPERIKGSKQKRSKDVLEGAKKGKKGTFNCSM